MVKHYTKWILISALVGVCAGLASTIFLASLDFVTATREAHSWLLYLLPIGGLVSGYLYHRYGKEVEAGNNLIIDEFHDPKAVIPLRMAPLVLLGSLCSHLFGGSAGREGTAVQMGASLADQFTHIFKLKSTDRRTLLMAGMAGGFGSVFGVPFAGAIFGLEVLAIGKLHMKAVVECAVASFIGHEVTLALGIHHTHYPLVSVDSIGFMEIGYALVAGVAFGLVARLFALCADQTRTFAKKYFPLLTWRAFAGGLLISTLFFFIPLTTRYAGLGIPVILESLQIQTPIYDWAAKLIFTVITLGFGFKGGEVTPLLFVGAALGNALTHILPLSVPMLAAMGLVGLFAGAANTPFACTIMAMELFGVQIGAFAGLACFASYAVSGHHGIYHTQRIHISKSHYASRTMELMKDLIGRRP